MNTITDLTKLARARSDTKSEEVLIEDPITEEIPDPEVLNKEHKPEDFPKIVDEKETEIIEPPVMVSTPFFDNSSDDIITAIRKLKEDVGQLGELKYEENLVVNAFNKAFMEVISPLAKALPVDVQVLPEELGNIERANIIPQGELVLLHAEGHMISIDLTSIDNRDLLVKIIKNVMPKFNSFILERRKNIEKRLSFLSNVTKELQSIANAFTQS